MRDRLRPARRGHRGAGPRSDRGAVLPSPVVVLSVLAVTFAAIAFVATAGEERDERVVGHAAAESTASSSTATAKPSTDSATKRPAKKKAKKEPPPVRRGQVSVVVFNNSGITGLAGQVSGRASEVGWNVVGADNWYGTIPATTVYFGPKMRRAAKQLALDLGVERVQPAIESMSQERLTLILTGPLD